MTWLCRRHNDRQRNAETAAALRAQAEKAAQEAERKHYEAEDLSQKAETVENAVRAEMRRNSWTDTLFGVIQTGRQ